MQPEEREMLKKTLELAEDNNKMLSSIRRGMFWGRIMRVVYWVILVGAAIGVYYYIEPYIDSAVGAYGDVKGDLKNFGDLFKLSR
ncbi:MAG: hypothetical protein A3A96_04180 [Candidatus Zambryskibacteria bacterium RIFCSPLOWO2_01_FULL_39_39]|uniref:Uncharacterized protein n=1 Tax=Candidatus Zambryskibacteria bacterium RIFCSPLOWO2_01_FULL_39_39 TaxID=1802758 RepID=A0A1G2TX32_9BACT|nr:MAG: hypothetical protein UT00_C0003G0018 [Parcubacteria group bacterium GW2011_GWA1_38_7]OHA87327.1 MAG: hypothetical protein A2644_03805 [Candidatus Zambryskibacteria bacterium RIFCSPHIGHO2_01_FULL_39_63]OHA95302.1 MAG: hypothetical protein A3B88_02345 [Candidatus Zambryskibacteria bacterium RIFCSPHIGHO2_02_FULL_39_19]OHA98880.1 MAG: hypothetical protein A3F20_02440 [Candidatus Zambryskibacteria bacterium RIFCSPHIGHO2_12_FULL_39_21]OHB01733.1 MAG: hypothetical protein A3A96_04180 [Candidat